MTGSWQTWGIPTSGSPGTFKVDDVVSVEGYEGPHRVGSVHLIAETIYYGLWTPEGKFRAALTKECTEYIENKYSDEDWI